MAIPTNFQGYTPNATVTKSFKLLGSATTGIWANDVDGTLSATTSVVPIDTNLILLMDQAYTDAQLTASLKNFMQRMGAYHDGPGGQTIDATKQIAVTATTCT